MSLTRRNQGGYLNSICIPGFIYNLYEAYKTVTEHQVPITHLIDHILSTMLNCYFYYNSALSKNASINVINKIEEMSRTLYYDFYKEITFHLAAEKFQAAFAQSLQDKIQSQFEVMVKITWDDFMVLMESKEKVEMDYLNFEKQIWEEQLNGIETLH